MADVTRMDDLDQGIACPRCGCRRHEITHTIPRRRFIRRYRLCDHCGARFRTRERWDPPTENPTAR